MTNSSQIKANSRWITKENIDMKSLVLFLSLLLIQLLRSLTRPKRASSSSRHYRVNHIMKLERYIAIVNYTRLIILRPFKCLPSILLWDDFMHNLCDNSNSTLRGTVNWPFRWPSNAQRFVCKWRSSSLKHFFEISVAQQSFQLVIGFLASTFACNSFVLISGRWKITRSPHHHSFVETYLSDY